MGRRAVYMISFAFALALVLTRAANAADPSLVGYWTFDEGSGTTAYDSSGQGNDGTIEGGPQWVPGKIGGALQFDGADDQIKLKSVFATMGSSSNTVAGWIKVPLAGTEGLGATERVGIFLGNYNDSPNTNWELHSAGQTRLYWNGGQIDSRGTTNLRDNVWHHIAWVRDKAANACYTYIDGRLEATHPAAGTDITFTTTHRIGGDNRADPPNWHGLIDDVQVYSRALPQEEIVDIMKGLFRKSASSPSPDDKMAYVPRDVILSWTPGDSADKHDVYFGTSFNDVNDASRSSPRSVLASQGQTSNTYDRAGVLDFGQTYYWRVDEVNAPPGSTIYRGEVWSFTVEPLAYPIENITATASSSNSPDEGPERTINGSGLNASNLHSAVNTDMWLSSIIGPQPTWIQYEFDRVYKLYQMWVWNHNSLFEPSFGLGVKNATIEYSVDGTNWTTVGTTHEFVRAPGTAGYAPNTTVDLGGAVARYVKITANSNWGGILSQYGLSEMRFFSIPVFAREPSPVPGATDVSVDATLSWRAGREPAKHNVYLSTDQQAVLDETIGPVSVPAGSSYASYGAGALDLSQAYYWKVNEVNEVETPPLWRGDVWNFTTQEYLVVDDFEDYNDYPPHEIYAAWRDGYEDPANGSMVGHLTPPLAETKIVHGGRQSMPVSYDNSTASYSEATASVASLAVGRDWTKYGIKTLSLYFCGEPNNAVGERMYVKLNSSKVVYDCEAENVARNGWQPWNIELSSFGIDLRNVTTLSIGFERSGTVGGTGVVYFDDIRLYSYSRQLITPLDPGPAGLVGHWKFDEGSGAVTRDSSGQGNDGTFQGSPRWVSGKAGGALQFDGDDDQIKLKSAFTTVGSSSNTVAAWIKVPLPGTETLGAAERVGILLGNLGADTALPNTNWELHSAGQVRLYWNGGQIDSRGMTDLRDNKWHHIAWVRDKAANACYAYIDGRLEVTHPAAGTDITFSTSHCIGGDNRTDPLNWHGLIDDLQVYSRVLSQEEISWLAGRKSFDKPF